MNMRKIVLCAVAILLGIVAVYVFFFSSSATTLPSSISNTSRKNESPKTVAEAESPEAKNAEGESAHQDEPDIENIALRGKKAEEKPADLPETKAGFLGTAAELFFYLILIVALVVGLLIFLKKIIPGGHRIFDSPGIEIIGKSNLTPKQAIYLARLGRRVLVLGVAEDSVSLLTEIRDADEISDLRAISVQGKSDSITNAFRSIFGRKHRELAAPDNSGGEIVQEELDRIHSMVDDWQCSYASSQ